ncbi:MAG: hypothetical protein M0P95_17905 [Sulfuritalea sp.]|jgi:hypothetical protein|nr:hypothetical protein [Sulfuritalea sp.]
MKKTSGFLIVDPSADGAGEIVACLQTSGQCDDWLKTRGKDHTVYEVFSYVRAVRIKHKAVLEPVTLASLGPAVVA